jgi:hypothetical protein
MNCSNMLLIFPGTHCSIMKSPMYDSHLLKCFDHIMSCQVKTTIATEVLSVSSLLYEYLVHGFDTTGHMTTMIDHLLHRLVFTYNIGLWKEWSPYLNERSIQQKKTEINWQNQYGGPQSIQTYKTIGNIVVSDRNLTVNEPTKKNRISKWHHPMLSFQTNS